jgi:hypothetical protein
MDTQFVKELPLGTVCTVVWYVINIFLSTHRIFIQGIVHIGYGDFVSVLAQVIDRTNTSHGHVHITCGCHTVRHDGHNISVDHGT